MAKSKVEIEMDADEAKLFRKFVQMERRLAKQEQMLGKVGRAGEKTGRRLETAGKRGERAFGSRAVNQLAAYAGGFFAIDRAVQAVISSLKEQQALEKGAGQRITDVESGRRALAQLVTTTKEYRELNKVVDSLRSKYGLAATEAYKLVFAMKSGGEQFMTQEDLFGGLSEISLDPSIAVTAAQKLQSAFGGQGAGRAGGGSARQIVNKVLAASKDAPTMASEVANAASIASAAWAEIGGMDESLLAVGGILSETFRTPMAASEKIKSLADQLVKKREQIDFTGMEKLGGLDLVLALPQLAKEGRLRGPMTAEGELGEAMGLTKFLGESNAIMAMSLLKKREADVRERIKVVESAEAETGTETDRLTLRQKVVGADEQLQAIKDKRVEEQRRQLTEEKRYGSATAQADALEQAIRRKELEQGATVAGRFAAGVYRTIQRTTMGSHRFLEVYGKRRDVIGDEAANKIERWRENVKSAALDPERADRESVATYFESIGQADMAQDLRRFKPGGQFKGKALIREFLRSKEYEMTAARKEGVRMRQGERGAPFPIRVARTLGEVLVRDPKHRGKDVEFLGRISTDDYGKRQKRPLSDEEKEQLGVVRDTLKVFQGAANDMKEAARDSKRPGSKSLSTPEKDL